MFEKLRLNKIARRLKKCEVTPLSRPRLRDQKVTVGSSVMKALDYIDHVAKQLPPIAVNGKQLDYVKRMREIYYRNGLKGLNLYVSYIRLRIIVEKKRLAAKQTVGISTKNNLNN